MVENHEDNESLEFLRNLIGDVAYDFPSFEAFIELYTGESDASWQIYLQQISLPSADRSAEMLNEVISKIGFSETSEGQLLQRNSDRKIH